MLKEFTENISISLNLSAEDFQKMLTQDFIILIRENCEVDLAQSANSLTSLEFDKIISTIHTAYTKILENKYLSEEQKIFVANSLLCRIFELWKISTAPELFFIKIRDKFTPAEIVSAFSLYMSSLENFNCVAKFFAEHKNIFPAKKNKIRTIAIYCDRIHSGGVERFLSVLIPIYIRLGYKIVLFTDEYKPELEYKIRGGDSYIRINFKTNKNQIFERLNELTKYVQKYNFDLYISPRHWGVFSAIFQILFFKLFGIKVMMQFHEDLSAHVENFYNDLIYKNADSLIVLSRPFKNYWQNFGLNSYCIPNPIFINNAKKFHGRNAKKKSYNIICVGVIADHKVNLDTLKIIQEVSKIIPHVKLKIVGSIGFEHTYKAMQEFIKLNRLEKNVEFCGYHKDVGKFYQEADVMLNTSPKEGFGLAIAESKFYELPLVLYKLERNELLRDGKGYIAVEQGDFQGAAQAIIKILTDSELRCRLSAEARESIQPLLDYDFEGAWQKVFKDLENDEPMTPSDLANEEIQKYFLGEIWQKNIQINNLIQRIRNLEEKLK